MRATTPTPTPTPIPMVLPLLDGVSVVTGVLVAVLPLLEAVDVRDVTDVCRVLDAAVEEVELALELELDDDETAVEAVILM